MTARLVDVRIEVPGTPEQVWEAIATGPGIACWFVPAEVDERVGGEIVTHHGPYGDSKGVVTGWEPPRRFAYEEHEWAEGAPPWATEMLVEARAGGTCLVRLISGIFSGAEDWADEIDSTEAGWRLGLENLRLYLTHFAGRPCTHALAVGTVAEPHERAWPAFAAELGVYGVAEGARVTGPRLDGVVERALDETVLVRDDHGIVEVYAHPGDGRTHLTVRGYRYGPHAAPIAAREQSSWRAWMEEHVSAPAARRG
jgi:uncharacterized protein YndB with AHSA1/START domain